MTQANDLEQARLEAPTPCGVLDKPAEEREEGTAPEGPRMEPASSYPRTTDVEEMKRRATPQTLAFHAYWDSKRRGRKMPARADIDPVEMRQWLPGIQLIGVTENPRQLRYRLVGEVEVSMRGFNHQGRLVEDAFFAVSREEALRNYNLTIDGKAMVYDWAQYTSARGYVVSQETIFLPLSNDDDHVNMVMTYTVVNRV
jgi:hypothetical protein